MTLTDLSYNVRKFAPFAVLGLLVILILYYLIQLVFLSFRPSNNNSLYINPIFGKIKKPVIKNAKSSAGLNYTIDTIEGKPITATDSASVYFLPTSPTRFGYREKIYLIAKTLGFDPEVVKYKLDGKEAVFNDSKQTLRVDITNFNFTYEYNFDSDPQVFQGAIAPDKKESEDRAINFLKSIGRYPEELAKGKTNSIFVIYEPGSKRMTLTEQGEQANMIEVDFYRPDIEQRYPIVSPTYFNSPNYVMMVPYQSGFKIIKAQVQFFDKSDVQIGTYPLKTGDVAWEEFKKGGGWIIQNQQNNQNVVIKSMFLGYLDPDVYQEFLQPVYVFLGEDKFVGYMPAVSDAYMIQ